MFKPGDVGKEIIINDTVGATYLKIGAKLKITKVYSPDCVLLSGCHAKWNINSRADFDYITPVNTTLVIGDEVIVNHDTTSIDAGSIRTILAFLNGDPNKIVLEGVISGGWITVDKLTKSINLEKTRVKTCLEIMYESGVYEPFRTVGGMKEYYYIFGRKLSEIGVKQMSDKLLIKGKDGSNFRIPSYAICDADKKVEEYDIIVSKYILSASRIKAPDDATPPPASLFEAGKNYNKSEKSLIELSQKMSDYGEVSVGHHVVKREYVTVVKKGEEAPQALLPF